MVIIRNLETGEVVRQKSERYVPTRKLRAEQERSRCECAMGITFWIFRAVPNGSLEVFNGTRADVRAELAHRNAMTNGETAVTTIVAGPLDKRTCEQEMSRLARQ